MTTRGNIAIEDARIGFRNFSGKEGRYNPKGRRNFVIFLEGDIVDELAQDGWNIRWLEPREEGDEQQAYLPVAVAYTNYPPKIVAISSNSKTILDEDSVHHILDWADIENVDVVIRPYHWDVNGKQGIKAYVRTMYVTLTPDEFEDKYRSVPQSSDRETFIDDEPVFDPD